MAAIIFVLLSLSEIKLLIYVSPAEVNFGDNEECLRLALRKYCKITLNVSCNRNIFKNKKEAL